MLAVELLATGASLLFLVLLIREKILCWPFGIAGSLLSVYLFIQTRLYSEAVLYLFYALMGVWGWIRWQRRGEDDNNPVIVWPLALHLRGAALACLGALGLGYLATYYSDASRPLIDAFTTAFSFLATYMEINKVLEGWIYWFFLNLVSIWLYQDRSLDIYAALIAVYSVLSVVGFLSWLKSYRTQAPAAGQ
ncbi:MAG: hypothetical protein Hals2KO_23260 [Halioglobus sp.]